MEPQSGAIVAAVQMGVSPMTSVGRVSGLASDSRKVRPGYLFAALPGFHADGTEFIADAAKRGAVAVLGLPQAGPMAAKLGVRFIASDNPRLRLAQIAAEFFDGQPDVVAAVTGTNGKTSVTAFLRQIWAGLGHSAASMGTIGVVAPFGSISLRHTTPDPIELHRLLARLNDEGIECLAMEASSHGLDQYRLDGVDVAAAAFTNISRDHLDYHPDFSRYMEAKLRLFRDVVRADGVAVVNADDAHAELFADAAKQRGCETLSVGEKGEAIRLLSREPGVDGQMLRVQSCGTAFEIALPLAGDFQASNALVAAGLAIALGDAADQVFAGLGNLKGAPGRLEKVAYAACGAPIFVDYAHTPAALETMLAAIRPHVRGRLHLVFGCGGDRDRGKRPLMGAAAARLADSVIVTDDNPRGERASDIRREILADCSGAQEIGDRAQAIRRAVKALGPGDILVIAGKGHEEGQIIGSEVHPFADADVALKAALALGGRAAGARR